MIIGIAGSFGAGKGAVVAYLIQSEGFSHFSASGFITEEIEKRKLPINRDSMIVVANDLRQKHGPSYIVDTLYDRAKKLGGDAVIESLRAVAEVKRVQELGGVVLGIEADPHIRYQRTAKRKSVKDNVSFDKWLTQERQESQTDDETKQDIFSALALADYTIMNNGTMGQLVEQVREFLNTIESD